MPATQAEIIRLSDVRPDQNQDISALHAFIVDIERQIQDDESALAQLDQDDAANYRDAGGPQAQERVHQRVLLEASLKQKRNRLAGARQDLAIKEQVVVYLGVQRINEETQRKIEEGVKLARQVDRNIVLAIEGISKMNLLGKTILSSLRGARGRSTLTEEGHVAAGDITAIADVSQYQFWLERHVSGLLPGWRTPYGAGPSFSESAVASWENAGAHIAELLGDGNFPQEVIDAAEQQPSLKEA